MIFKDRTEFRKWLMNNHATSPGIHVVFVKGQTLTYADALEEAICFGWIDGVVHKLDKDKYTRYFIKRSKMSNWSEKNKKLALGLIQKGLMTTSGLAAIKQAKQNGMWDRIQNNSVSDSSFIEFIKMISENKLALTNFENMSASVRKTYVLFYFDAKTETGRAKRLEKIISRLEQNLRPM